MELKNASPVCGWIKEMLCLQAATVALPPFPETVPAAEF
jgi:hypothetical protein